MAGVVSLVPSITETLLTWGVEPVACTRFCEQPDLRHVGGTKDPDVDAIVALQPDLVLVNDEENRREDFDALVNEGVDVHVVRIGSVAGVAPALDELRRLLDLPPEPPAPLPEPLPPRATVFVPIWRRPWMTIGAGTYGTSVLAHLGLVNVFADEPGFPTTDLDAVAARSPDLVLAPSEPYPFKERHRAELEQVAPVVLVDGQDLFWWGPRTPAAIRRLADATGAGPLGPAPPT